MGAGLERRRRPWVVGLLVCIIAAIAVVWLVMNQGMFFDQHGLVMSIDRLEGPQPTAVAIDPENVSAEAPVLAAALERALAEGQSGIMRERDVRSSERFLRENLDPEASSWIVEYKSAFFYIGFETS